MDFTYRQGRQGALKPAFLRDPSSMGWTLYAGAGAVRQPGCLLRPHWAACSFFLAWGCSVHVARWGCQAACVSGHGLC